MCDTGLGAGVPKEPVETLLKSLYHHVVQTVGGGTCPMLDLIVLPVPLLLMLYYTATIAC